MPLADTRFSKSTHSSRFDRNADLIASPAGLVTIGLVFALVSATWRIPLQIPGHHGLEWMLALCFARLHSPRTWATSITAAAAAAGFFGLSGFISIDSDIKTPLFYLLTGGLIDLLYLTWARRLPLLVAGALLGGVTFLSKPAVMLILVTAAGASAGMFRNGALYPFVTHFAFGLTGGVGGALLALSLRGARRNRAEGEST